MEAAAAPPSPLISPPGPLLADADDLEVRFLSLEVGAIVEVDPDAFEGRKGSVAEIIGVSQDWTFVDFWLLRKDDWQRFKDPNQGIKRNVSRDAVKQVLREAPDDSLAAEPSRSTASASGVRTSAEKFCQIAVPEGGVICVFWDLEGTHLSPNFADIIQIAAVANLFRDGEWLPIPVDDASAADDGTTDGGRGAKGGEFGRFVRTKGGGRKVFVNDTVASLTGIDTALLEKEGVTLEQALLEFEEWILALRHTYGSASSSPTDDPPPSTKPADPHAAATNKAEPVESTTASPADCSALTYSPSNVLDHDSAEDSALSDTDSDRREVEAEAESGDEGVEAGEGWGDGGPSPSPGLPVWLVAHSGFSYDLPLLFNSIRKAFGDISGPAFVQQRLGVHTVVDSLRFARKLRQKEIAFTDGDSLGLGALYARLVGGDFTDAHNALADSRALAAVMAREPLLSNWRTEKLGLSMKDFLSVRHEMSVRNSHKTNGNGRSSRAR
ncbi:unnamed protein product [Vitrella brassicaformis CCMP3155]|uniref:Exonuclease domain-containing protein n=2 Tax=Vitrella brassicaformis TaxID=1169539 RepID=A0A0G4EI85_VITBC|nr:unnamed protein product [Vitrella brassicaformis CCMP3155]|mmetsp:Transcript_3219/g.8126  ORF Transcript_3219/g.8126 Transcript_3219/m.8126 type:complete len:497 (+) Transcript_3219:94-1584(+)|eukprot:CEL95713.1 unnamed protein product [Vitrella brassicaformis CCMP3155]